ncbi:MAG: suppressor of fused domain protein [Planctomycetota bacterium]
MDSNDQVETLLFERSPYDNLDAIVEQDGRVVYLYLSGSEEFGVRACWVRNLVEGPLTLNQADLEQGLPPVLPRIHCHTNQPGLAPKAEDLRVVWFTEGNGLALLEGEELLAVIPPWSGIDGFHGYARDCASENEICWPMPESGPLQERIALAAQTWETWKTGTPFAQLQPLQLTRYSGRFGSSTQYFSIDGQKFPPRGLGVFRGETATTLATVGMSLVPQPNVEMAIEDSRMKRRIELALRVPHLDGMPAEEAEVRRLAGRLAGLASAPWKRWTWYGQQHTCDFDFSPDRKQAVFIRADSWVKSARADDWGLPHAFNEPVSLLYVAPLTAAEFAIVQSNGLTPRLLDQLLAEGLL